MGEPRTKEARDAAFLAAVCEALRAWVRADAEGLPEVQREARLREARRLTGVCVGKGLISGRKAVR